MKVGLIGNPNVGKSTIFNALTEMHQHTGNGPGKTVEMKSGFKVYNGIRFEFDDLPGTYSLTSHSMEEEVTRDFVYFGDYDVLLIVTNATTPNKMTIINISTFVYPNLFNLFIINLSPYQKV